MPDSSRRLLSLAAAGFGAVATTASAQLPAPAVTFSTVGNNGYAQNDINSVSFSRSNLVTSGDYQYIAYYDGGFRSTMHLGRRTLGTNDWSVLNTGLEPVNIDDSHDNINLAIDGNGRMHVAWGVHNNPMNYVISSNPVTGADWSNSFINLDRADYWSGTSANHDNAVTYPEFYNIPGSGDLLFTYRQGGSGGGSGNGDQYFARYDAKTGTFDKNLVIQGTATSVNAYLNRLVYDSTGTLRASWTWRDTPDFQTNHNLAYAQSADDGRSWTNQFGNPYALPITENEAQVIADIPRGSSLINQTDMAVDSNDNPLIATWYVPEGGASRQYMLHYYDGTDWQASQITDRAPAGDEIRRLGRPLVMADNDDKTLVVMRYDQGSNNGITIAISEDNETWEFITLADENLGIYEPSYDSVLWERENKLHLFYQPLGLGPWTSPVSVLEWDAAEYFASMRLPGDANDDGVVSLADFLILRANFGTGDYAFFSDGDFNTDGQVSLADFLILRAHFGDASEADAAAMDVWRSTVPEPASLSLLGLGGLVLLRRGRRTLCLR